LASWETNPPHMRKSNGSLFHHYICGGSIHQFDSVAEHVFQANGRCSLRGSLEYHDNDHANEMAGRNVWQRSRMSNNTFTPGPAPNTVRSADGEVLTVPNGWVLLPPGDAALTRRVKTAGDHWIVQEKKGRKVFSRGVWAPAATIERIRADLDAERSTESFAKKREADARRRDKAQAEYVEDFFEAVRSFLAFHANYADLADRMARAVTDHATPVGSGTVARTKRIPVEQRAEAAVIAWMRHKTTAYESMVIPKIKGKRREVRRMLARRSHELLERYRRGEPAPDGCPLHVALLSTPSSQADEVSS
jgi:hypothetical protein